MQVIESSSSSRTQGVNPNYQRVLTLTRLAVENGDLEQIYVARVKARELLKSSGWNGLAFLELENLKTIDRSLSAFWETSKVDKLIERSSELDTYLSAETDPAGLKQRESYRKQLKSFVAALSPEEAAKGGILARAAKALGGSKALSDWEQKTEKEAAFAVGKAGWIANKESFKLSGRELSLLPWKGVDGKIYAADTEIEFKNNPPLELDTATVALPAAIYRARNFQHQSPFYSSCAILKLAELIGPKQWEKLKNSEVTQTLNQGLNKLRNNFESSSRELPQDIEGFKVLLKLREKLSIDLFNLVKTFRNRGELQLSGAGERAYSNLEALLEGSDATGRMINKGADFVAQALVVAPLTMGAGLIGRAGFLAMAEAQATRIFGKDILMNAAFRLSLNVSGRLVQGYTSTATSSALQFAAGNKNAFDNLALSGAISAATFGILGKVDHAILTGALKQARNGLNQELQTALSEVEKSAQGELLTRELLLEVVKHSPKLQALLAGKQVAAHTLVFAISEQATNILTGRKPASTLLSAQEWLEIIPSALSQTVGYRVAGVATRGITANFSRAAETIQPAALPKIQNLDRQLMTDTLKVDAELLARAKEAKQSIDRFATDTSDEIICVIGLPGAGKSTLIREILDISGGKVFHVGKFAKQNPDLFPGAERARSQGALIPGVDDHFLNFLAGSKEKRIILDGHPRSPESAAKLTEMAARNGYKLTVIEVSLNGVNPASRSFQRQVQRAVAGEEELDVNRFANKTDRAVKQDLPAIALLKAAGVPVKTINSVEGQPITKSQVRSILGSRLDTLEVDRTALSFVDQAAQSLGLDDVWLTGGSVYRPFFNNKFGPIQGSYDYDVCVYRKQDVIPLQEKLRSIDPSRRWAVASWEDYAREDFGITGKPFSESLDVYPVTWRQSAVRMRAGKVEFRFAPGAEGDLRRGVLRLDEAALGRAPEGKQEELLNEFLVKTRREIENYPGLSLEGRLKELYENRYGAHRPILPVTDFTKIREKVVEAEGTRGKQQWNGLRSEEVAPAEKIAAFYRNVKKEASQPIMPRRGELPKALEELLILKEKLASGQSLNTTEQQKLKTPPELPKGYSSWLEYVAGNATDSEFHNWLLNQTRSRNPIGGKDPVLRSVLDHSRFTPHIPKGSEEKNYPMLGQRAEQKITHAGWTLDKHLLWSALQLHTDGLVAKLESSGMTTSQIQEIRTAMRLGMLWHDAGKLINVHTAGVHEVWGARIWQRSAPDWISPRTKELTTWVIETHDLYGRMARSIDEKTVAPNGALNYSVSATPSYRGAIDPTRVRQMLLQSSLPLSVAAEVHKQVWLADIGSVSTLRYLLPLGELCNDLVLSGSGQVGSQ